MVTFEHLAVASGESRPALVVVNYGSSALLSRNLPRSASGIPIVVVVDSWSGATERETIRRLAQEHGWLLEEPDRNTGFGTGCNLGAARALHEGATTIVLLNPDAWIDSAGLATLVEQVEDDRALLLAPRIVNGRGAPWMSGTMDLRLADGTVRSSRHRPPGAEVMEWVSGAVMVMSAVLWSASRGFDDDYFLYWEDIDLCRRVQATGGSVRVDSSVTAVHDEGGTQSSTSRRAKSGAYYRFNIRNRALYASKWLDPVDRRRWARQIPRTAWGTLLTGGRRQFLQGAAPWAAYVRGVLAAYRVVLTRRADRAGGPRPAEDVAHIRVLESFAEPSAATNPYLTQLRDALAATPGVEVQCWTWRTALTGQFDVFHTHWTEALIERRGPVSTVSRRALFAAFVLRLWLTGRPVVRTAHNLELPEGLSRTELYLLRCVEGLTTVRVVLNGVTPVAGGRTVLVEHGHYRDWFAAHRVPPAVPGRLAFVGKVRRYKNVEGLLRAFRALPAEGGYSLHVSGRPSTARLAEALGQAAAADTRIELALAFVDDADFVREVGEAELVVLPYHEMHNSGSVLAALSLDRPVLVPDNDSNRALADEVGEGWVIRFLGDLDAAGIQDALHRSRTTTRAPRPDLTARDWSSAGLAHRAAFRTAVAARRRVRKSHR